MFRYRREEASSHNRQLSLAFNTCREEVMRRGRDGGREEEREGGRETLLGDRAYILNFNKIRGEERERERGLERQQSATCSLAEWRKGPNCVRA